MKTWFIAPIIVLLIILLSLSCNRSVRGISHYQPPCERDQTGTVCFHNATRKDVKIRVGDTKTEVAARTTRCFDLYRRPLRIQSPPGLAQMEQYGGSGKLSVELCVSGVNSVQGSLKYFGVL